MMKISNNENCPLILSLSLRRMSDGASVFPPSYVRSVGHLISSVPFLQLMSAFSSGCLLQSVMYNVNFYEIQIVLRLLPIKHSFNQIYCIHLHYIFYFGS